MATQRITDSDLRALCDRLNKLTGSPMQPYAMNDEGTRSVAQVGNFHISGAYGGVCLHRMSNTSGGVHTPIGGGHVPKRELWLQMNAFFLGIDLAQYEAKLAAKGE